MAGDSILSRFYHILRNYDISNMKIQSLYKLCVIYKSHRRAQPKTHNSHCTTRQRNSIILIICLTVIHKLIQGIGRIEDENISSGF